MLPRPDKLTYLGINLSLKKWFLSLHLIWSTRKQFLFLFLVTSIILWQLLIANLQQLRGKAITPHYCHPRLILISPIPAHTCQHWPHPIPQIIHQARLYSLESGVQLHKQQEVIFNTFLLLPWSLWYSIQSPSNSTC